MKIAACFLYILLCIVYLVFGDSSITWGAINIVTQTSFIGYLSFELYKVNKGNEQLFFQYITGLSIANVIYISVCVYKDKYWILYNTDMFAYILGIGFLVFLFHCALKHT